MPHIPDNYDAFAAHDAQQDAWLRRRPRCSCCKERIQDEYLYDIGGDIYCERCIKEEFRQDAEDYEN